VKFEEFWQKLERPPAEDWEATPLTVRGYVDGLERCLQAFGSRIDALERQVAIEQPTAMTVLAKLEARIAQLEQENQHLREQLARNSQNSSQPPSSDPPSAPKRAPKTNTRKKRGGQPGHRFHARQLVAVDACRSVTDHLPEQCRTCSAPLEGVDPTPVRHQIVDLPPIVPIVDEHRLHERCCRVCGSLTRAELPAGVTRTGFGPGVEALVALLSSSYQQSCRQVQQLLSEVFSIRIAVGTVASLRQRVSTVVAAVVEQAHAHVQAAPVRSVDETPWRQHNADGTNGEQRGAWLWCVSTPEVKVYRIELSRRAEVARELIGEQTLGTVVTDRYSAYSWLAAWLHQVCWAHLLRNFRRIAQREGESGVIGQRLVELAGQLFAAWHRVRDGTLDRVAFAAEAEHLRTLVRMALVEGTLVEGREVARSAAARTAATCAKVLEVERQMWLFVYVEGVEPTSNDVERALRRGVLLRKVVYGTQSSAGSRFVERMLTVVETLRAQGRGVFEYLVDACTQARVRHSIASLLPSTPARANAGCS
jgi:hypothetical protein